MLVFAIAHGGCTDTVRESALEVDWRKIPCRTGDSNLRQYCAWVFSRTLYPLSHPRTSVSVLGADLLIETARSPSRGRQRELNICDMFDEPQHEPPESPHTNVNRNLISLTQTSQQEPDLPDTDLSTGA